MKTSLKNYFNLYLDSYRGLSNAVWMLSLVIFLNRSGAMVLPFLGVYLSEKLSFTIEQVGYVLSSFGLGSLIGSWLGGYLTDRFGPYKVQLYSLILAAPVFCIIPFIGSIGLICFFVFLLSLVSDIFRPANSVSISIYAKPENITKAFSLNRMAVNLGFSIGPALGGYLAALNYNFLFFGNALAALIAALVFYIYFSKNKKEEIKLNLNKNSENIQPDIDFKKNNRSPYSDLLFILFCLMCTAYSVIFFQFLNTMPLYYKDVIGMNKQQIGTIMAYSGLVVFSLEMLLVNIAETRWTTRITLVVGTILCGIGFYALNVSPTIWMAYISITLLCVSEIFAFPFMSAVAVKRASKNKQGAYMGMNSLAFSLAFIISPFLGTKIIAFFGFDVLWDLTLYFSLITALGYYFVVRYFEKNRL